ncbi:MAG TPA: DUF1349 domain-containing protein [Anaerolineales bacterium]|nr:DUF1349 domain-containing protein [Anaerolineales bacterium]
MTEKLLFVILAFLLSACGSVAQPALTPVEHIELNPLATRTVTPAPSPSPTATIPTSTPVPTADPNFFRDDFTEALDPNWTWVREDPLNWSLSAVPGSLQINVEGGYVPAHTNANMLLRPAPDGNFQIETQISYRPNGNFQFAGLIIYQSDSDFIQAGREYCGTSFCIGEGLYMENYELGKVVQPTFGQPYRSSNPILLRLSRRGDTYTFDASTNGNIWFTVGSHTSEIEPLQIGLVTGQRLKGDVRPAVFNYFEVRSLP